MKYGSKATAFNGVLKYVMQFDIEREKKNLISHDDVNKIMIAYRTHRGETPSKNYRTNAESIQKNFASFGKWMKENYNKIHVIFI